jgi:Zn finger protein HypA/HybF involved in hydrogenase expression
MEQRFLCKKCWLVFDKSAAGDGSPGKEITCPQCRSANVMEAPAWVPLDSGSNIITGNEWSYECQDCKYRFRMPIPKSPEEDKSRKCPGCQSGHLHLITGSKSLPLYCG